jgi:hypothetical protein
MSGALSASFGESGFPTRSSRRDHPCPLPPPLPAISGRRAYVAITPQMPVYVRRCARSGRAGRAQPSAGSSNKTGRRRRPAGGDGTARRPETALVRADVPALAGSRAAGGLRCSSSSLPPSRRACVDYLDDYLRFAVRHNAGVRHVSAQCTSSSLPPSRCAAVCTPRRKTAAAGPGSGPAGI